MLYGEAIDEVLERVKAQNKTDQSLRNLIGLKLNMVYKELCNNSMVNFKPLIRNGNILTVPNYTTGTISITKYDGTNRQAASTVTGSGTSWTNKMVGRYFKHENCSHWYKIVRVVSGTELILDQPIVETSASGLTYKIWKRFYLFPSNVERLLSFGSWNGSGILTETGLNYLRDRESNIASEGIPEEYVMNGMDEFNVGYSTGTVSITENDNVLTGVGTEWMDNVSDGDLITIGDNEYHIERVESDTRIILKNYAKSSVTNDSYTIKPYYRVAFELFYQPNSEYILPYVYLKRVFNLVNEDYDRFDVPERFENCILDGAEYMRRKDLNDSQWQSSYQTYTSKIVDLKRTDMYSMPRFRILRPHINDRGGYV